jgi:hypothetical protein
MSCRLPQWDVDFLVQFGALYRGQGLSIRDTASRMGLVPSTLRCYLGRLGVSLRNKSDAQRLAYSAGRRKKWAGARNPAWNGGRYLHAAGYVMVHCPGHPRANGPCDYVMEHILVAEQKIGRQLRPGEEVHHVDGDKQNNAADNLLVLLQEEHVRLHVLAGDDIRGRGSKISNVDHELLDQEKRWHDKLVARGEEGGQ